MKTNQSRCRILLVDDDPVCHLISEKMIKLFSSHKLESFINPVDALNNIQWRATHAPEELPNLILLDLDMPHMDGWRFLDEFTKLENAADKTSVFILTSSAHHADKAKAKKYGIVKEFFSKPLTEEMIRAFTDSCVKQN